MSKCEVEDPPDRTSGWSTQSHPLFLRSDDLATGNVEVSKGRKWCTHFPGCPSVYYLYTGLRSGVLRTCHSNHGRNTRDHWVECYEIGGDGRRRERVQGLLVKT